jgi:hypothetical protein
MRAGAGSVLAKLLTFHPSAQIKCERLNNKIGLITAMTMAKTAIHSDGSCGSGKLITS